MNKINILPQTEPYSDIESQISDIIIEDNKAKKHLSDGTKIDLPDKAKDYNKVGKIRGTIVLLGHKTKTLKKIKDDKNK